MIKSEKGRVEVCDEILRAAHRGACIIVTSAITLAEVVRPRPKGALEMTEAEDAKIVAFFRSPFLRFVDFNPTMGQLTRQLQWRHKLHVRDAVHVASAIFAKVPVIESYDPDLLGLDRAGIPTCPEIRMPKGGPQATIFQAIETAAAASPASPASPDNAQASTTPDRPAENTTAAKDDA